MVLDSTQEIIFFIGFFLFGIIITILFKNYQGQNPEVLTSKQCKDHNLPKNDKRFTHIFTGNVTKRKEKANNLIEEIKPNAEECSNQIKSQQKILDTYMIKLDEFKESCLELETEGSRETYSMATLPEILSKFTTILKNIQAQLSSRTDLDHHLNFLQLVKGGHEKSYVFRHMNADGPREMKPPEMAMVLAKFSEALELAPSEYKKVHAKWINEINS